MISFHSLKVSMIIIVLSMTLSLVLLVLYVMQRVVKQEEHLNNLKRVMMERKQKEAEQSKNSQRMDIITKNPLTV